MYVGGDHLGISRVVKESVGFSYTYIFFLGPVNKITCVGVEIIFWFRAAISIVGVYLGLAQKVRYPVVVKIKFGRLEGTNLELINCEYEIRLDDKCLNF